MLTLLLVEFVCDHGGCLGEEWARDERAREMRVEGGGGERVARQEMDWEVGLGSVVV